MIALAAGLAAFATAMTLAFLAADERAATRAMLRDRDEFIAACAATGCVRCRRAQAYFAEIRSGHR